MIISIFFLVVFIIITRNLGGLGSNTTPASVCTTIKVVTKKYGYENTWTLGACESKETYKNDKETTQECCQAPGKYELECKDSFGDGWNGGYLEIQGKIYCADFLGGQGNHLKTVPVKIVATIAGTIIS